MADHSLPLALTPGEPGGVGAEIAVKCWNRRSEGLPPFFLIDDPKRVEARAKTAGLPVTVGPIAAPSEAPGVFGQSLPVLPISFETDDRPGELHTENAAAVIDAIESAVSMVVGGQASAIVTNPIQKETLYAAGFDHPGHTEFLGALSAGNPLPVMMLATDALKVIPATIHIPLSEVPGALSQELLIQVGKTVAEALTKDFGFSEPRLAFAGLNPHAGENSTIGTEDRDIILPAIKHLRQSGIDVAGPLPGDTMFHPGALATYDAAVCMYHDQALIPIKTIDFWGGVNVTIGLPFVRTSPDHGTALQLAGTGEANEESLFNALKLADRMAQSRQRSENSG